MRAEILGACGLSDIEVRTSLVDVFRVGAGQCSIAISMVRLRLESDQLPQFGVEELKDVDRRSGWHYR
jgi:hypothetical protein